MKHVARRSEGRDCRSLLAVPVCLLATAVSLDILFEALLAARVRVWSVEFEDGGR
jgi:hypothetical protein